MAKSKLLIPLENIQSTILLIRGEKVMIDADLAEIYGVSTKNLTRRLNATLIVFRRLYVSTYRKRKGRGGHQL